MPRARKGTAQVWYDTFAEWPEQDRAVALRVLEQLHRQLGKSERRNGKGEQEKHESIALNLQGPVEGVEL